MVNLMSLNLSVKQLKVDWDKSKITILLLIAMCPTHKKNHKSYLVKLC